MHIANQEDTIVALATAAGVGALGILRISGRNTFEIFNGIFSKDIRNADGYTLHYGRVIDGEETIDDVVVSVFRGPKSFTGEDTIELSCHGSPYIQSHILQLLIEKGCRLAEPGEFSMRAFAHGKMDLSQAEAIADLIASSTKAAHKLAMNQMRGQFSRKINDLRERLIHFASLIELELDFGEEDVEFADRKDLKILVTEIRGIVGDLIASFATGNAIKNGVPVAILGAPNMGKSTLLNALLGDDRAIVSAIAGTTRDTIEDESIIEGVRFRFIDTAGLRETEDEIESIGISKAWEKAEKASILVYMIDAVETELTELKTAVAEIRAKIGEETTLVIVANKVDKSEDAAALSTKFDALPHIHLISASEGIGLEALKAEFVKASKALSIEGQDVVVTNARHYEALSKTDDALGGVLHGLSGGITGDFLATDIRRALFHLGEITGEITTDDLLGNIFSKFCIGK